MATIALPDEYRQVFEKLKEYVNKASHGGGLKSRSVKEIEGFAHHYLVALGMLSRMKANPEMRPYLGACQQLLVDANLLLYPEEGITLAKIWRYIWVIMPAQMWQNRWFYIASTGLSILSAVVAFFIVMQNFETAPMFMSGMRSSYELEAYLFSESAQKEMLTAGRDGSTSEKAMFALYLMNNNIGVAIKCFALGFLFGIPTVILLIFNGLMLGALPALFWKGDIIGLGAWLLPHGVPELGAIFLAGGAGLKIGLAELQPSVDSVWNRLRKTLRHVAGTVLVCTFLLIWAGIVESFVRQSELSTETRYAIAAFSTIPYFLLFLRGWLADRQLRSEAAESLTA